VNCEVVSFLNFDFRLRAKNNERQRLAPLKGAATKPLPAIFGEFVAQEAD
jgi:hypothetical protein